MNYKYRKVVKALEKKGFQGHKRGKTSRHAVFELYNEKGESTTIKVSIPNPHKKSQISDFLCKSMALEIGLDRDTFQSLIECPLSRQGLYKYLREKERII